MRLHLDLTSVEKNPSIPVNYNYPLGRAIMRILAPAEERYEKYSRGHGMKGQATKRFKLYAFSGLEFYGPRWSMHERTFHFEESLRAKLIVTFPHPEEFVLSTIVPLFNDATLQIPAGRHNEPVQLEVQDVEPTPFPAFPSATYRVLSPVTIRRAPDPDDENQEVRYLSAKSRDTGPALVQNLIAKHEILTGERLPDDALTIQIDREYLRRTPHIMRAITIREGTPDESRVRCFVAPLHMAGDERLIRAAFACGIGEKNRLGFGMIGEPFPPKRRSKSHAKIWHG